MTAAILALCAVLQDDPLADGYAFVDEGEPLLALACFLEAGDAREAGLALAALDRHEEEVLYLGAVSLEDPADHFNLVMALRDAGRPGIESLLREVAWRTHPADELFPFVLFALAEEIEEREPVEATALFAQVEHLNSRRPPHGKENEAPRSP